MSDETLDFEPLDYGAEGRRHVPDGVVRVATRYGFIDIPEARLRHQWRLVYEDGSTGPAMDFRPEEVSASRVEVRPIIEAGWERETHPWVPAQG